MLRGTSTLFYKALNRQFTMLGVNQRLFFLFGVFWLPLAFAWKFKLLALIISAILFIILHSLGILLTKTDDQIVDVYNRHRRYKNYYPPIAGIHASTAPIRPSVPYYEGKRGLV